jgi:hypothetical protein
MSIHAGRTLCRSENPEDCASCQLPSNRTAQIHAGNIAADSSDLVGQCKCRPSERCALCSAGTHYRIEGKCELCPDNVELVIVGFVLGIIFLSIGGFILDRRNFNMAFISIGVDYFQVLALFSSVDVAWPPLILYLYRVMGIFNFNIDVVAPECLLPELDYEVKFYGTLALPLFCLVLILLTYAVYSSCVGLIKSRNATQDKYAASRVVGTTLIMVYYLYLSLTRRALEVFNCNPVQPDDGYLYTSFTSLKCSGGGLCRCYDATHVQSALILPAVIALLVYTLGFPAFVMFIVRKNKRAVKHDQILRALGTGDDETTNPYYFIRRRYHKMYYHFKPGKIYWMVIIIFRKTGIAAAGLLFRSNPGFQLASVLLVLFVAYVWQVKHQPYMSTAQRNAVVLDHRSKAEQGDRLHVSIAHSMKRMQSNASQRALRQRQTNSSLKGLDDANSEINRRKKEHHDRKRKKEYFFDFNTVEQILLSCAIFVCLSGVMFESDRFQNDVSGRYNWQRDVLTFMTIAVIIFSLIYYASVFTSEIAGYTPKFVKKYFASKQRGHDAHLSHLVESSGRDSKKEGRDSVVEMHAIRGTGNSEEESEARRIVKEQSALVSSLQNELDQANKVVSDIMSDARLKKQEWNSNPLRGKGRGKKKNGGKKASKKKTTFAGRRVSVDNDDSTLKTSELELVANAIAVTLDQNEKSEPEPDATKKEDDEGDDWETFHSKEHDRPYYVHKLSRKTSWVKEV